MWWKKIETIYACGRYKCYPSRPDLHRDFTWLQPRELPMQITPRVSNSHLPYIIVSHYNLPHHSSKDVIWQNVHSMSPMMGSGFEYAGIFGRTKLPEIAPAKYFFIIVHN